MIVSYEEAADFYQDTFFTEPRGQLLVRAADAFIKRYCGRPFERGTYTEVVTAAGGNVVYVSEENITAIDAVWIDASGEFGAGTDISDIALVHAQGNRIVFEAGYWPIGDGTVKITYTGGYYPWDDVDPLHVPKMPDDLRLAALRIMLFNRTRSEREVYQSESFTGYSYARGDSVGRTGYDDMVMEVLDSYRRWL